VSKDVRRARALIDREHIQVLAALTRAGEKGTKLARRQAEWKREVEGLLERGRAAGVSITEMARALGLSRQWTSHLAHPKAVSDVQMEAIVAKAAARRSRRGRDGPNDDKA
jgi:hypothetical protein